MMEPLYKEHSLNSTPVSKKGHCCCSNCIDCVQTINKEIRGMHLSVCTKDRQLGDNCDLYREIWRFSPLTQHHIY